MKIIDKNKDYYDFYGRVINDIEPPVFDRRGSCILTNNLIVEKLYDPNYSSSYFYAMLVTGYERYLFRFEYKIGNYDILSGNYAICTNIKFLKKYSGIKLKTLSTAYKETPLCIYSVRLNTIWSKNFFKYKISDTYREEKFIDKVSYDELINTSSTTMISLPILKDTSIPSFIPVHDMWVSLENYFISLSNDKDISIETNNEKIVNHGFDLKTSFRKM